MGCLLCLGSPLCPKTRAVLVPGLAGGRQRGCDVRGRLVTRTTRAPSQAVGEGDELFGALPGVSWH